MRIEAHRSTLIVIDFQARLMPAIDGGVEAVLQAQRLVRAAALLEIPTLYTEQNPKGLGATVDGFAPPAENLIVKTTFDAMRAPGFLERLAPDHALILVGCETHVCVLQTALGLLDAGRSVFVVADAVGSRKPESKRFGLSRAERNGAEIVTTEMVVFEWLADATHPKFREIVSLIK
jgi:nicotinamidase-related amidase